MNVTNVKKEPRRIEVIDSLTLGIQNYGVDNLYPQTTKIVVAASGTATSCVETYSKFLEGKGFKDVTFYTAVINEKGLTNDALLSLVCKDIAYHKGFALHVNYNLLGTISDVQFTPFENCRLAIEDESGYVSKIAVHRDWQRLKRATQQKGINKETIDYIDVFNPIHSVVQAQMIKAGGIHKYKGQILWVSFDGDSIYPKPVYDSVITDISTESGLSNVNYRNVRYNFLPAGMLVRKKGASNNEVIEESYGRPVEDDFTKSFKQFQGDENACKIIDVEVEYEEEEPKFVPFGVGNNANQFSQTKKDIQENIGKVFRQPPILRAESVSTGFTAEAMKDAYNFYNSITDVERRLIERSFKRIFDKFYINVCPSKDFSILPLKYITDEPINILP